MWSFARVVAKSGSRPSMAKIGGRALKGSLNNYGYIVYTLLKGGKSRYVTAHSLVAEVFIGPRPPGLDIRHLDGDKLNNHVSNLAYGTRTENMMDEVISGRNYQVVKTHCPSGHEYSGTNLRVSPGKKGRPQRICRECVRMQSLIEYRKKRDARLSPQEKAVIEELRRERESAMIASASNTK